MHELSHSSNDVDNFLKSAIFDLKKELDLMDLNYFKNLKFDNQKDEFLYLRGEYKRCKLPVLEPLEDSKILKKRKYEV